MIASPWPGWLVIASIVSVTVGCLLYAASGAITLHRVLRREPSVRPVRVVWAVERLSPDSGQWVGFGAPYTTEKDALAAYTSAVTHPSWGLFGFRVVEEAVLRRSAVEHTPKNLASPAVRGGGDA